MEGAAGQGRPSGFAHAVLDRLPGWVVLLVASLLALILGGFAIIFLVGAVSGREVELWGAKLSRSETVEEKNCRMAVQVFTSRDQALEARISGLNTKIADLDQQMHDVRRSCLADTTSSRGDGERGCTAVPDGTMRFFSRYRTVLQEQAARRAELQAERGGLEKQQAQERQHLARACFGAAGAGALAQ